MVALVCIGTRPKDLDNLSERHEIGMSAPLVSGSTANGGLMSTPLRRTALAAATLATLLVVTVLAGPPSDAHSSPQTQAVRSKPGVDMFFVTAQVSQGVHIQVRFTTVRAPLGSTVAIQREFGSAHAWRTVKNVRAVPSGITTVPGDAIGPYSYRAILLTNHKAVASSRTRPLYSFGPVTLVQLCSAPGVSNNWDWFEGSCGPGHTPVEIGGSPFVWAAIADGNVPRSTAMSFPRTSCRSVFLQFGQDDAITYPLDLTLSVRQTTLDPVAVTVNHGLATLTARLDGGPWNVDGESSMSTPGNSYIYVNGYATCYTASGLA